MGTPRNRDYEEHARRLKRRFGADYYALIGAIGGKHRNHRTGGFAADKQVAREAGLKGGRTSKRGYRFIGLDAEGQPQYLKER